jgi:hypothetical protein
VALVRQPQQVIGEAVLGWGVQQPRRKDHVRLHRPHEIGQAVYVFEKVVQLAL